MSRSSIPGNAPDGRIERRGEAFILRFERHLAHPIEQVWAAITEPEQLLAWLGEAEIEPVSGGHIQVRWLNSDRQGNSAIMQATITQFEPPHLLEYAGDIHGVLRFELREEGTGCCLTFSSTLPAPNAYLSESLAGWHSHLDFLEEALEGQAVDWTNWPFARWSRHHERYTRSLSGQGESRPVH